MKKLSLEELQRIDIETFKNSKKLPVIIILDNIRSQFNIGSIFRNCDAFRVEELILCGITAQPPSREIEKSALGATQSVQWKYFKTTQDAIDYCKNKSFFIATRHQILQKDLHKVNLCFIKTQKSSWWRLLCM